MKQITICTNRYYNELENFIKNAQENNLFAIAKKQHANIKLVWDKCATEEIVCVLIHLLYSIATNENPVYRHSPKLKDLSASLQNTSQYKNDVKQLKTFLQNSKELHIDGYVAFRMEEYKQQLDMMLYKIVKKINFGK